MIWYGFALGYATCFATIIVASMVGRRLGAMQPPAPPADGEQDTEDPWEAARMAEWSRHG